MKNTILFIAAIALVALLSTSCQKTCSCTVHENTVDINLEDMNRFVGQYVDLDKYGIDIKECDDLDEWYDKAEAEAQEHGIEIERRITCK